MTKHRDTFLVFLFALILILIQPASGHAQNGYPQPADLYVNDFANIIDSSDEAEIRRLFTRLREDEGVEAVVLTINSIQDYDTGDATIESFATNLFNTWGIGNAERNDGVLILVAQADRQMRIEIGRSYGSEYDAKMAEVINEHMLPRFREGEFSYGITRGAMAMISEITGEWPEPAAASSETSPSAASPSPSTAVPAPERRFSLGYITSFDWYYDLYRYARGWFYTLWGTLVASVGGAIVGLPRYFRYRKRKCPLCGHMMERLDEASDDVYLDSGQKLEEVLASVDYDVWKCPVCHEHELHRYARWFSSHSKCPQCNYRTVKTSSQTLVHATYSHGGQKRLTKDCQQCDYYATRTVHTPKLQRSSSSSSSFGSSSSSGSSFGGGSSSGGGASGSW